MGPGLKAIAMATIMLAYSTTADAVAWKVKGYYYFWMDIEEVGFKGEALLKYSTRLTATQIDQSHSDPWFILEDVHGLKGWDRVNDGPWMPMVVWPGGSSPTVSLLAYDFCNPDMYDDCPPPDRDFLQPVGAVNWDAGQFSFFRVDGLGSYAWFEWAGTRYECDWEDECRPGPDPSDESSRYDFTRGWEGYGTFTEVPEPALPILFSIGLSGLIVARRRRR